MPEERIIRVLRILEYIGPEDWVRNTLAHNAIQGTRYFSHNACITSAVIAEHVHGELPKPSDGKFRDEDPNPADPETKADSSSENVFPRWTIAVPNYEGGFNQIYGPFADVNVGLLIEPEYPNSVMVCFESPVLAYVSHLWSNGSWHPQPRPLKPEGNVNGSSHS